jgi:hypothetical protein
MKNQYYDENGKLSKMTGVRGNKTYTFYDGLRRATLHNKLRDRASATPGLIAP